MVKQLACAALPDRQVWRNNLHMNIGDAIKALRVERDLTQEELALEADLTAGYLSRIEAGKRKPTEDMLKRLATVLDTSVATLYAMTEREEAPDMTVPFPGDLDMDDYSHDAVSMRKTFRELTPANQRLAVEMVRLLLRLQTVD